MTMPGVPLSSALGLRRGVLRGRQKRQLLRWRRSESQPPFYPQAMLDIVQEENK
jgi:hypothetical protein